MSVASLEIKIEPPIYVKNKYHWLHVDKGIKFLDEMRQYGLHTSFVRLGSNPDVYSKNIFQALTIENLVEVEYSYDEKRNPQSMKVLWEEKRRVIPFPTGSR